MNIAILYDSRTGTTLKAARAMGQTLEELGHSCQVKLVTQADASAVSEADFIFVGSWVQGFFIILQHPTKNTMDFIEKLGELSGKRAAVFCTYKVAAGSTLGKMAKALERKGAMVEGQFKFKGPEPDADFASFAKALA